jgi:predicted transposase YbfD/YdcC
MEEIIRFIVTIPDNRQEWKVVHMLRDIVVIVLFATLANADDWVEIGIFAEKNEGLLKKYIPLENGAPSHDTIQRVMASIEPAYIQSLVLMWNEFLSRAEGEKLKKVLCIDGKTMRGSGNKNQEALHVVSAWAKERGVCFGQKAVAGKGYEISAIKELLDKISVKDQIVTIDAIGTQKDIAEKIIKKNGDYVLAVKENQAALCEDIRLFFNDREHCEESAYQKVAEKARGQIEKREYWQTDAIEWLQKEKKWAGLKSIGMTRNTIQSEGKEKIETRYFISSLSMKIEEFAASVRGHWAVESMHWHLDVTFREDKNQTLEKTAAENLNIIRKWALSILKILDLGKKYSLKKKRFVLSCDFKGCIETLMAL